MSLKALVASSAVVAAGFYYQWQRDARARSADLFRSSVHLRQPTDLERQYLAFAASPLTAASLCERLCAEFEAHFAIRISEPLPSPFYDDEWLDYYTSLIKARDFYERWRGDGAQRNDRFLTDWLSVFDIVPTDLLETSFLISWKGP
jgi:hypothetical protein